MSLYAVILPEMGEGVIEATLIKWLIKEGDYIAEDQIIAEVATDKVDSDVTSPKTGYVREILYQINDVMPVGKPIVMLEVIDHKAQELNTDTSTINNENIPLSTQEEESRKPENIEVSNIAEATNIASQPIADPNTETLESSTISYLENQLKVNDLNTDAYTQKEDRYLSPLVKNIAKEENITAVELTTIIGTGAAGRLTKDDLLNYIAHRQNDTAKPTIETAIPTAEISTTTNSSAQLHTTQTTDSVETNSITSHYSEIAAGNDEIIEMDRMRKLIAKHMVDSKRIAPHVSSFVEVDMTQADHWRDEAKIKFKKEKGQNFTFMPIFIHAVIKAIKDFPQINVQLIDENSFILKKNINIGIAVATQEGNLIVPVIKNADHYSLSGLAEKINDLAHRARIGQLKPDEIKDGTYTITNIGTFGNVFGTPIINQPQSAILAVGAIQKKVAVIETEQGDMIGIRKKMYLSHSYDHRIIDGALGGMFVKRVGQYLEQFDETL